MTEETTAVETVGTVVGMVVTTVEDGMVVTAGLLDVVIGAVVVAEAVVVAMVVAAEEEVATDVSLVVAAEAVVVPVVVGDMVVAIVGEEDVVGRRVRRPFFGFPLVCLVGTGRLGTGRVGLLGAGLVALTVVVVVVLVLVPLPARYTRVPPTKHTIPLFEPIQYPTVAYRNPTCPFCSYRNLLTVSLHVVCANFIKYCSVLAAKIPHPS